MRVVGLMSGTSVDGIDVAVVEISGAPPALHMEQLAFATVPWATHIRDEIFAGFHQPTSSAALCRLNFTLGEAFAAATLRVLSEAGIDPQSIDLIGSHGQTLWHDVQHGQVTSTLQLGEPAVIAARTGITTVGNFRVADVAVGGQGAPLVAILDWYCLRPPAGSTGWRAMQNIGGMGNVTLLPPLGVEAEPLAFDTGPGNALIDWAAQQATANRWAYDVDGQLAASGHISGKLLEDWLDHPYFAQPLPKSTGRETFSVALAQQWQAQAQQLGLSPADFIATLTELTAASIADAYTRHSFAPISQAIVSGGGARNPTLMARTQAQLHGQLGYPVAVVTHEQLGINSDAKEALLFALLAYLCVHGWPGNLPACTGASRPQVIGQIAPGDNFTGLSYNQ